MPQLTDSLILNNLPAELSKIRREINPYNRHMVFEGMLVGAPKDYLFDPTSPHSYCRLCGAVYQTPSQRSRTKTPQEQIATTLARKNWCEKHSASHSRKDHTELIASGRYMTPEATLKLVPLGIIPLTDMVFSKDHEDAAGQAPRLDLSTQSEMEEQQCRSMK